MWVRAATVTPTRGKATRESLQWSPIMAAMSLVYDLAVHGSLPDGNWRYLSRGPSGHNDVR